MSHSRRTLSLATVVVVLTAAGAGVGWRLLKNRAPGAEAGPEPSTTPSVLPEGEAPGAFSASVAQPVSGAGVRRDTLWIRVRAAGQAEAWRRTTLSAQVEGVIRSIPPAENDAVAEGVALVQIDTVPYALDVAQARADLRVAETDYRQRILFDDEIENPSLRLERERIARATSGLDQAEVAVRRAELVVKIMNSVIHLTPPCMLCSEGASPSSLDNG